MPEAQVRLPLRNVEVMADEYAVMTARLVASLLVGGLIGLERSFRGRPAGFRTHTLVCLASTVLMLVTVYEARWMPAPGADTVRLDPTRMAQGIMTGIGFLGAGVIFKEGLTVRGLTTAASIWVTAAIGILIGIGFYFPAGVTAALVIFTLSIFHWIEMRMPMQSYARLELAFARNHAQDERHLRALLASRGFNVAHVSCRLTEGGQRLEYRMMVRTSRPENFEKLAAELLADPQVSEFRIAPTGD